MPRAYLSNIRSAWPIARQEAALNAGVLGWRRAAFRDVLPPRKMDKRGPADLVQRADMLRPTRRRDGSIIAVASLAVLAWTRADFLTVLDALAVRYDTLHDLDTGIIVRPDAEKGERAMAADAFDRAVRRTADHGKSGGRASGEKRSADAKAGCARIAERWKLPSANYPTATLLAEAGVSRPTAIQYLGPRQHAQWAHARAMELANRNRARRRTSDE